MSIYLFAFNVSFGAFSLPFYYRDCIAHEKKFDSISKWTPIILNVSL